MSDEKQTSAPGATAASETLESLHPLLFSIAYRMLGSVSDAEDIVQQASVRYLEARGRGTQVDSLKSYLSAVVTRLAIDELRSARARRETYVGEWLPEPLLTDAETTRHDDPAHHAEQADSLSMAFLLLLERLSPVQRAVYLLHDIFDYSYKEIAPIVNKTAANCRRLAVRARQHMEAERPRFDVSIEQRNELAAHFFDAIDSGDVDRLAAMMARDVSVYGDGGGKAPQWMKPVVGGDRVTRLLAGVANSHQRLGLRIHRCEVNTQPGALVLTADGQLINVYALDITNGFVQTIRSVINPDKLRHIGPLADISALQKRAREGSKERAKARDER